MPRKPTEVERASEQESTALTPVESRRITSKGQVTIPDMLRKRYDITMRTRVEFIARSDGILIRPAVETGSFEEMAGSASTNWSVKEMLKRLDELRMENA